MRTFATTATKAAEKIGFGIEAIADDIRAEQQRIIERNNARKAEMVRQLDLYYKMMHVWFVTMIQMAFVVLFSYWVAGKTLDFLSGATFSSSLRIEGAAILQRLCEIIRALDLRIMMAVAEVLEPVKNWILK